MRKARYLMICFVCAITMLYGCGKSGAASEVENMISSLDEISLEKEESVKAAEKAYDDLNDEEKKQVENYEHLTEARKELNQLLREENQRKAEEELERQREELLTIYDACNENIISTGRITSDDFFTGYVYTMPVAPGTTDYMKGSVGTVENSRDLWLLFEFSGTDPDMQGFRWSIDLTGEQGIYEITVPLSFSNKKYEGASAQIKGSFDLASYSADNSFIADEVSLSDAKLYEDSSLMETLKEYPKEVISTTIDMLDFWLDNNGLGYDLSDLGIGQNNSSESFSYQPESGRKSGTKRTCPNCNGVGAVKTYYGATDLEAYLDGHDPYEIIECPMCHGTGEVTD